MISHCCKGKLLKKNSRGRQRTKNWKCLHLLGSSSFQRKGRIWLELSACHCPLYAGVSSYSLHSWSVITVSAAQLEWKQKLFSPETFKSKLLPWSSYSTKVQRFSTSIPQLNDRRGKNDSRDCLFQLSQGWHIIGIIMFQFSSVAQSCPTLCDPMNCSTPGLPVHHQLVESTQTRVLWVGDAIQPSHPLLSPSPLSLNLSQHQGLFKWVSSSHQVAKVLEVRNW